HPRTPRRCVPTGPSRRRAGRERDRGWPPSPFDPFRLARQPHEAKSFGMVVSKAQEAVDQRGDACQASARPSKDRIDGCPDNNCGKDSRPRSLGDDKRIASPPKKSKERPSEKSANSSSDHHDGEGQRVGERHLTVSHV